MRCLLSTNGNVLSRLNVVLWAKAFVLWLVFCATLCWCGFLKAEELDHFMPGIWRSNTVINGMAVTAINHLKADGTFHCVSRAGNVELRFTGRYVYANGRLSFFYDNGWFEEDSVTWINKNQRVVTCLNSTIGGIGVRVVCNRIR